MSIALQYCHITVNDVDESLGFYRDALGLEVQNDVGSGGFRWVTLGSQDQPGLGIDDGREIGKALGLVGVIVNGRIG